MACIQFAWMDFAWIFIISTSNFFTTTAFIKDLTKIMIHNAAAIQTSLLILLLTTMCKYTICPTFIMWLFFWTIRMGHPKLNIAVKNWRSFLNKFFCLQLSICNVLFYESLSIYYLFHVISLWLSRPLTFNYLFDIWIWTKTACLSKGLNMFEYHAFVVAQRE